MMRDIAITLEQAAHWLNCSTAKVKEYLAAGRLRAFEGKSGDAAKVISLNATVILAESLPPEAGIFQIAEKRDYDSAPRPRQAGMGRERPPLEVVRTSGPIVERRPLRPFVAR
ncbi:hypothetical protein JL101_025705 [Skermanella rosea]|uniref:hypothetical protein n=1 Tax=Skermanella rosea TaxID=1817965 RepID=UPI001931BF84|nr:hypothetical protein [Skermanella rosea]UEM03324.1 hypothetical protein JL101_025705 [Skermanella rosea]